MALATLPRFLDPFRRMALAGLRTIPLGTWTAIAPKDVVALCYHVVSDEDLPHQVLYAYKTRAQFTEDLKFAGARAISYDQVAALRRGELQLPPQRFLFTFDDGFVECSTVAWPLLRAHRVPGAFFVNVEFLDNRRRFFEATISSLLHLVAGLEAGQAAEMLARLRGGDGGPSRCPKQRPDRARERLRAMRVRLPATEFHVALAQRILGLEEDQEAELARAGEVLGLSECEERARAIFMTTDQVRKMAAEGATIGSHGFSHAPMQGLEHKEIERIIAGSCAAIRDLTGQRRVPFAFPYSANGIDRGLLADIRTRNPFVDLYFDTEAFHRDASFVVQRVAADAPPAPGRSGSNLPAILRGTWSRRSAWYREGVVKASP